MKRWTIIALSALTTAACAEATLPPGSGEGARDEPSSTAPGDSLVSPRVHVGDFKTPSTHQQPVGNWVRDVIGDCVARENWLVLDPDGELEHVVADRGACANPTLERWRGEWTTKDHVAVLQWANDDGRTDRVVTFDARDDGEDRVLRLGAYVPVDGGYRRSDLTAQTGGDEIGTRSVDVGLRIDGLELRAGGECQMSATVNVDLDGALASETFEFECVVEQRGEAWLIEARELSEGRGDAAWKREFARRGLWEKYTTEVAHALFDAFRPSLVTVDGRSMWHDDSPATYRATSELPPRSMADVDE